MGVSRRSWSSGGVEGFVTIDLIYDVNLVGFRVKV